jgi:hypothetical protein
MPGLNLIVMLVVVGAALYLINTYIPMASRIRTIINLAVVVVLFVWLLGVFGVTSSISRDH